MNVYTDSALTDQIQGFLQSYRIDGKIKYLDVIDASLLNDSVVIDMTDFVAEKTKSGDLFEELLDTNPDKFIAAATRAVNQIFSQRFPDNKKELVIFLKNIKRCISINESLTSKHIAKLVSVKGMVVGKFEIFNDLIHGVYRCDAGHETSMQQVEGMDTRIPTVCENSRCKNRQFELISDKSQFCSSRLVVLKSQDDFTIAEESLAVNLTGKLINSAEVGDIVDIVGSIKINQSAKQIKSGKYKNYLLANSVHQLATISTELTDSDIKHFKSLPSTDGFYKMMTNSIASSVSGLSQIKESILLQQIGSPDIPKRDGTKTRGEIHIGLWGHGGLAKSRLGEWLEVNFPKVKIVHSMGATGKGLLLGIEDNGVGGRSLHAGAFVYCNNGGTVILDEYPRLPDEVKAELMTTLESGFASIAKSGFQAKVSANASLIATGNAKQGEWDRDGTLLENLDSTTPELQRFDMHWIILDPNDSKVDKNIANAILYEVEYEPEVKPLEPIELLKYIHFVRQTDPQLTDKVKEHLSDAYLALRKTSKNLGISPRILNTMIRLTLASARLHQRKETDEVDADIAISLMKKMFDGQNISISEIDTYISRQSQRGIKVLQSAGNEGLSADQLLSQLKTTGVGEEKSQCILDLGHEISMRKNFKWRTVVNKLKRSPLVKILQNKPLQLAYNSEAGKLNNWID